MQPDVKPECHSVH